MTGVAEGWIVGAAVGVSGSASLATCTAKTLQLGSSQTLTCELFKTPLPSFPPAEKAITDAILTKLVSRTTIGKNFRTALSFILSSRGSVVFPQIINELFPFGNGCCPRGNSSPGYYNLRVKIWLITAAGKDNLRDFRNSFLCRLFISYIA